MEIKLHCIFYDATNENGLFSTEVRFVTDKQEVWGIRGKLIYDGVTVGRFDTKKEFRVSFAEDFTDETLQNGLKALASETIELIKKELEDGNL